WEAYFGVVAVAVAVALLAVNDHALWRRLLAVGAIAVMVVLHLVVGRRLIQRDALSTVFAVVQIALFAVAVALIPFTSWLLFAMIPMIFQLTSMWSAIVLV